MLASMLNKSVSLAESGIRDLGLDVLGSSADWFRAYLQQRGIVLHKDSKLALALTELEQAMLLAKETGSRRFAGPREAQEYYLRVTGADFLSKALHWGHMSGLRGFDEHFKSLRKADPILTTVSGDHSKHRSQTWELLLGSLIATFATKITCDEPDLLFEFDGRRTGVSAKVLYGPNAEAHIDRIREGAKQLERSKAEVGYVVVNLVEQFPHGNMFENFMNGHFQNSEEILRVIRGWMSAFYHETPPESWRYHLRGMSKIQSVIVFVPTVICIKGYSNPLMPCYSTHKLAIIGREEIAEQFEQRLHDACQDTLAFQGAAPTVARS